MEYLYNIGNRVYNAVASIPANISRRLFRGVLNELLGPYLKDKLQLENLDMHFGDGVFTFRDLVLEEDVINMKLGGSKLTCRFARIDLLSVSAPYNLEEEDLKIEAQGLTLVLSTSSDSDLFRSAVSSAGGSMMQSVFVPSHEDENDGNPGDDGLDDRPEVESNVYKELEDNIADLLESLRLRVADCRVLVENKGHVFELLVKVASLVDTRWVEAYTITPEDESFSSIAAKLGVPALSLPLPSFAVGEVVHVPVKVDQLTFGVVQKFCRFRGVYVSYLGQVPLALTQSTGAGEDLLMELESCSRQPVLSFDGDEESSFLLEFSEDKRVWCSVALNDEQKPVAVSLSEEGYKQLMAAISSVLSDEYDISGEDGDASVAESFVDQSKKNVLSDFSIMYHQRRENLIGTGPLQFASVLSDWSLLKTYSDTVLVSCNVELPLCVIELKAGNENLSLTVRAARAGVVSAKSLLQFTLEVDGGMVLKSDLQNEPYFSVFPSALPFSLKGELVNSSSDSESRKFLLSLDHCPPVAVASQIIGVINSLNSMLGSSSASDVTSGGTTATTTTTCKVECKQMSIMLDHMYDFGCSDVSLVMELASSVRFLLEAATLELHVEAVEVFAVKQSRFGLFWKGKDDAVSSSSVSPVNDLSKLVSLPFEGVSLIWGKQSTGLKLTPSFVSSFPEMARRSGLHLDIQCLSLVANVSQAQADRVKVWLEQPATTPLLWTTWAVSINSDCVISLLHESKARHDYCWQGLSMFGCLAMLQQDCGFLMLDGKRAQIFVSNPSTNVPRALMWQKLSTAAAQNELDAIELANLKFCIAMTRFSVTRTLDLRFVVRSFAVSPIAEYWTLAGDFFGGPEQGQEDVQEEDQEDESEYQWVIQGERVSVLAQSSSSSHAILCVDVCSAKFSQSGSEAWQAAIDVGSLKLFLSNRDTLPPSHSYLEASQFAQTSKNYCTIASLGGFNVGLMKDETIAVNLVNFQGNVLQVRTCADSLATAVVLGKQLSLQSAVQMGLPRSRRANTISVMEASTDSLAFSVHEPTAKTEAERGPLLAVVKTPHLEVHMFLLELREEFRVGSTVRVRWEYRKGVPTDYDWVAMYKTTRSRKSKNYYAESLTGGKRFGVLEWKVPNKLGSIHFRFFRGSGLDDLVAVSESFRVGPLVELIVTRVKTSLYVERVIKKNDPAYGWSPKPSDWIGLYQWNQSNKNLPVTFKKVGSDATSVPFSAPAHAGRFVFRYFADMGWGQSSELARSLPFDISEHEAAAQSHDLVARSSRQPKEHWQVSELHFKWSMEDGSDWNGVDSQVKRDEVMLQVQIPMATLSFLSLHAKHSVQLFLTVGQLELHDRVSRSNYRSLLQFPVVKRAANAPCAQLQLGKLNSAKQLWECRVDMAPCWLNVDQDTLIFVIRYGLACHDQICTDLLIADDPMEQSFVMLNEEVKDEAELFETLSVSAIDVEIDFRAKNRRMDELMVNRRHESEFVYMMLLYASALLSVNESRLTLDTVLLRNVKQSELLSRLSQQWFPQIHRDNVSSLLSGFEPVKFVFRLGEASISLVQAPLKQDGSFLSEGANLGKTIYVETFRGLSNLLVGTGNVVKNVNRLAEGTLDSGTGGAPKTHVKAHSPVDLQDGFALAGDELVRGFKDAFNGVFYAPMAAESATEGAIQFVRGLPGLVLKPVSSLFRAGSIPLRFAAASADPSIAQRAALKYKRPEQEDGASQDEEPRPKENTNIDDV